jgi:hypothetical protein
MHRPPGHKTRPLGHGSPATHRRRPGHPATRPRKPGRSATEARPTGHGDPATRPPGNGNPATGATETRPPGHGDPATRQPPGPRKLGHPVTETRPPGHGNLTRPQIEQINCGPLSWPPEKLGHPVYGNQNNPATWPTGHGNQATRPRRPDHPATETQPLGPRKPGHPVTETRPPGKRSVAAGGTSKSKELIRTRCGRITKLIHISSVCFCENGSLAAGAGVNLERNNKNALRTDYKVS